LRSFIRQSYIEVVIQEQLHCQSKLEKSFLDALHFYFVGYCTVSVIVLLIRFFLLSEYFSIIFDNFDKFVFV